MIDIRNCVFGFKCKSDWETMEQTQEPNIRHCSGCKKDVFQVSTKEELLEAIQLNRCIAIFDAPKIPDFLGKIDYEREGNSLRRPTLGVPARYKSNEVPDFDKSNVEGHDIPAFLRQAENKK